MTNQKSKIEKVCSLKWNVFKSFEVETVFIITEKKQIFFRIIPLPFNTLIPDFYWPIYLRKSTFDKLWSCVITFLLIHIISSNFILKMNFHFYHHHQIMLLVQISLTVSLSIRFYQLSLLSGFLIYILCPLSADVDNFLLIGQRWQVHVWGPEKNMTYEYVFGPPAMSHVSCSSYSDGFKDRR